LLGFVFGFEEVADGAEAAGEALAALGRIVGQVVQLGQQDVDWEITFRFAASLNRTGISVGSITGIAKKGWEYLWVRYADVEDAGSNTLVKQPVAAYVEQVYEYGNFAALGIGT